MRVPASGKGDIGPRLPEADAIAKTPPPNGSAGKRSSENLHRGRQALEDSRSPEREKLLRERVNPAVSIILRRGVPARMLFGKMPIRPQALRAVRVR
jgi:hypothetical protein